MDDSNKTLFCSDRKQTIQERLIEYVQEYKENLHLLLVRKLNKMLFGSVYLD